MVPLLTCMQSHQGNSAFQALANSKDGYCLEGKSLSRYELAILTAQLRTYLFSILLLQKPALKDVNRHVKTRKRRNKLKTDTSLHKCALTEGLRELYLQECPNEKVARQATLAPS